MTLAISTSTVFHSRPSQMPELLAPAGSWDCAKAAVENGADAIYFGLDRFNARMRAENFTEADLPELMAFLHRRGVKGYVTLNTLIFPKELAAAEHYLKTIIAAGVDAAIVQDVGICQLIRHLSPDFPIHASTQMTITSAAGVMLARSLGCNLVVLARECSLKDIRKIQQQLETQQMELPLEVFVHGALCVAYSGQCLTSEALGGRSANRGECAQACRMPYDLFADGRQVDLGDRRYLLSPQDLSGLEVLPELIQTGVTSLKIEGRLKTPEYVANVTRTYRAAIDRVSAQISDQMGEISKQTGRVSEAQVNRDQLPVHHRTEEGDRYNLEMAFSRGLYTGWFRGINNQALAHARFGKKRGVYLGEVKQIQKDRVTIRLQAPLKAGDGVVFDHGQPDRQEAGGRIYSVEERGKDAILTFDVNRINLRQVHVGDKVWKTSDPELDRQLRQTYTGTQPKYHRAIAIEIYSCEIHSCEIYGDSQEIISPVLIEEGAALPRLPQSKLGLLSSEMEQSYLVAIARDSEGHIASVQSELPLVAAQTQPLTTERLREQFGRLGNTPFYLERLDNHLDLQTAVMLPISELNRLRRDLVEQLDRQRAEPKVWQMNSSATVKDLLPKVGGSQVGGPQLEGSSAIAPQLVVLVRNLSQLEAALNSNIQTLYCEFEDPRAYRNAVDLVRKTSDRQSSSGQNSNGQSSDCQIYVAPPRITKPGEQWILQQVQTSQADGYLIRNADQLQFFAGEHCIGDFSLNVSNALTADYFKQYHPILERLTASYDLNAQQLEDLLLTAPPEWFEITIHQHMPMFHMEHCVFCAFLSDGTDFTNCGRPCETHSVTLRDRTNTAHLLQADVGCRNTVFNGTAQTGAEYMQRLIQLGARYFRIEFVNETPEQVVTTLNRYHQLLQGKLNGAQLWRDLKLQNQLGVTRGPLSNVH
jgi:U32 family peptidase